MKTAEKLIKLMTNKEYRYKTLPYRGFYAWVPDERYIKNRAKVLLGVDLDLKNPRTLNEKLNWLKIHDRNPRYTLMADKYESKKIVTEAVGKEYIIPLLGVWDRFDDIDFSKLPNQFVLKSTSGSGDLCVCEDKRDFDIKSARKKITQAMRINYYLPCREWVYKDIRPRVIAEEYIDSLGHKDSVEYKLTCFNGKVVFFTICQGPAHQELSARTNDHYDRQYNRLDFYAYYKNPTTPAIIPDEMERMIEISEKLSSGIPYLRVDFYLHKGQILLGEMTFYTWGGFIKFEPEEWDYKLGELLQLPIGE